MSLYAIIHLYSIMHDLFTHDLQLEKSCENISKLLLSMQSCISNIKGWATANMHELYDKSELMLVTSRRTKYLHKLPTSNTIDNAPIPFKQSVKNLGLTFHRHLSMNYHVSTIARANYCILRHLSSNYRFLTNTATVTRVSAYTSRRIDYCNSQLFGSTSSL